LFEIGNVYRNSNGQIQEHTNLFLLCFSKNKQPVAKLIGAMRELFEKLGIELDIEQTSEEEGEVMANRENLGPIRAVNDEIKWAAAELNFEKLVKQIKSQQFDPLSRFPVKEVDVALLVKEELPWGEIKHAIKHNLIARVELFDVYQGKNISLGKKSIAFRIVYQAPDHTLTNDEVNKIHEQVLNQLKSKFNAQVRD
jgi:phenylalanyl-tRNA synthetase beta chain